MALSETINSLASRMGKGLDAIKNDVTHTLRQSIKMLVMGALAASCSSADSTSMQEQPEEKTVSAKEPMRYITLGALKGQKELWVDATYPDDLRVRIDDTGNKENSTFVDLKGTQDSQSTAYTTLPKPISNTAFLTIYEKNSCEGDTLNCTSEVKFVDYLEQCQPGEKCISGNNEAPVQWPADWK